MMTAAAIAKALDPNYRTSGHGYVCKCPAHDDNMPSLKVSDGDEGKILVHCHAGCDPKAVIDKIDARGLWPKSECKKRAPRRMAQPPSAADNDPVEQPEQAAKPIKSREVCKYEYFDHENGELRMQVIRYEPKTFKQRRPDLTRLGEWTWKVGPAHRTLYNAPRAFRHDKTVFVVEGEKDVDNLAAIDVVAVCNPGGAGKWQDNYSEILRGKDVVLVPDNDGPGRKHADLVGEALQGVAQRVRVVMLPGLPEKGDISDWLEIEGNDRKTFVSLVRAAPDWTPPVSLARVEEQSEQAADYSAGQAPFQCLGYNKDTYYYLSKGKQQVTELSAGGHTKANLLGLADYNWWRREFPSRGGAFNVDMASNAMMRICERKGVWSPADIRGRGSWMDADRIIVHCGDIAYVNRVPTPPGAILSKYVYEVGRPMRADINNPLSVTDAELYLKHMQRMPFARDLDCVLMAGWTVCAHIGGVLNWRPHVWVVGAKGTGKSYVMDRVVKPLFGPDRCLSVASSTTEAGLRQSLGSDAIPVLFDEAEGQDAAAVARIQRILETVRQSSSETGAKIAKGTTSGSALSFNIRSCFMFASINASIVQQSDRSRITVVELKAERQRFKLADLNRLGEFLIGDDYAKRYQARAISLAPVIRHNADVFSMAAAAALGEQRAGDQYGALLAGAYSLTSDEKVTLEQAEAWLGQFDLTEDKAEVDNMSDELACLQYLLQQIIRNVDLADGKRDLSIAELVEYAQQVTWDANEGSNAAAARRALLRIGFKLASDGKGLLISNTHDGIKRLLMGTPWSVNWGKVLGRLPDAYKPGTVAFAGKIRAKVTWVPIEPI